jgi:hypothetical protein
LCSVNVRCIARPSVIMFVACEAATWALSKQNLLV